MINFSLAEFETAFGLKEQLIESDLPEIIFSGKSNVGKSSLINKTVNRKALARVSSTPGKTITINFYRLKDLRLVDLPGYGFAKVSYDEKMRWSELMEGYFAGERNIKLIILLIDMRHPPTKEDEEMMEFLEYRNLKYCIVLTKCDKLNKTQFKKQLCYFNEYFQGKTSDIIPFSSIKNIGVDEIRKTIENSVYNSDEA